VSAWPNSFGICTSRLKMSARRSRRPRGREGGKACQLPAPSPKCRGSSTPLREDQPPFDLGVPADAGHAPRVTLSANPPARSSSSCTTSRPGCGVLQQELPTAARWGTEQCLYPVEGFIHGRPFPVCCGHRLGPERGPFQCLQYLQSAPCQDLLANYYTTWRLESPQSVEIKAKTGNMADPNTIRPRMLINGQVCDHTTGGKYQKLIASSLSRPQMARPFQSITQQRARSRHMVSRCL
jgi:hypothetical protein